MKGWVGQGREDKLEKGVSEGFSKKMAILQSLLTGAKLNFESIQF